MLQVFLEPSEHCRAARIFSQRGWADRSQFQARALKSRDLAKQTKPKNQKDEIMKNKKADTKINPTPKVPASKPEASLIEVPSVSHGNEGDICTLLAVNAGKVNNMQPALLGLVKFGELAVSLSLWWSETLDQTRDFFSMTMQDAVKAKQSLQRKEKVEPLARLKLYQFRKDSLADCDYLSSTPFLHEGRSYWALLWVDVPEDFPEPEKVTEANLKQIRYYLVFSLHRPSEKWESGLKDTIQSAQQHLLARRRELEERKLLKARQVQQEAEFDADEIP